MLQIILSYISEFNYVTNEYNNKVYFIGIDNHDILTIDWNKDISMYYNYRSLTTINIVVFNKFGKHIYLRKEPKCIR